jgi:hypothetical protein
MASPAAPVASSPREIRVFISSTFRDMYAERDHLVTVVLPECRGPRRVPAARPPCSRSARPQQNLSAFESCNTIAETTGGISKRERTR